MRFLVILFVFFVLSGVSDAQPTPYKVMPLGDSITQADTNHNSYRRPLWRLLQAAHIPADFVGSLTDHFEPSRQPPDPDFDMDHEGHAAWRTEQILAEIPTWAATYQPDVVLIHLGTNDLMAYQTPESTRDELGQIIDALRDVNPNIIVLLAQIIPYDFPDHLNIPPVDVLNVLLPDLVAQKRTAASPVYLVDLQTGFNIHYHLDPVDRVHPTPAGERLMALRWFDVLKQILPAQSGAYELVNNGGFEIKNAGWKLVNTSQDKTKCNTTEKQFSYEGDCAFRFMGGEGEASHIVQTIFVMDGTIFGGDLLNLSVYARAGGTPRAKVKVFIYYVDGTQDKIPIKIMASAVYTQYIAPSLTLANTPTKFKIKIINRSLTGVVLLDGLSLTVTPVIGR